MASGTRAEQAERTRQSVLDTARRLFAERGYAATSLQQLADAMGVHKANVYYYFPTKAAILDALLDERVEALETLAADAEGIADLRARRAFVIDGFARQVVIAHRSLAPIDFADPSIRTQSGIAERLDALAARAARGLFGDSPTPQQLAGFAMMLDLKPALRQLSHLPDDQLADALTALCRRMVGDEAGQN